MTQQILNYQATSPGHVSRLLSIPIVVTLLVNAILLLWVYSSGNGWLGLGVTMFVGPIVNLIILISHIAVAPFLRKRGIAIGLYLLAAIVSPLVAIPVDGFIIYAMPLHAC